MLFMSHISQITSSTKSHGAQLNSAERITLNESVKRWSPMATVCISQRSHLEVGCAEQKSADLSGCKTRQSLDSILLSTGVYERTSKIETKSYICLLDQQQSTLRVHLQHCKQKILHCSSSSSGKWSLVHVVSTDTILFCVHLLPVLRHVLSTVVITTDTVHILHSLFCAHLLPVLRRVLSNGCDPLPRYGHFSNVLRPITLLILKPKYSEFGTLHFVCLNNDCNFQLTCTFLCGHYLSI